MNFLKRGITSITRIPGKSALFLLLTFFLGTLVAGAISIRQAVEYTERDLRTRMSPVITITFDYAKALSYYEQDPGYISEPLSPEIIEEIGAWPYVRSYDYSVFTSMVSCTLTRYTEYDSPDDYEGQYVDFGFKGVQNPNVIDLKGENFKLISGRVFNEQEMRNLSYVVLISQDLAELNDLTVGSKVAFGKNIYKHELIPVEDNLYSRETTLIKTQEYEFEIIGIYEAVKQNREDGISTSWGQNEADNRIYAPNKVLLETEASFMHEVIIQNPEMETYPIEDYMPLYVLNDPVDLNKFRQEATAVIPDCYVISDNGISLERATAPIRSLKEIASLVLYTSLVTTFVLLSLLITLFLRDRKHELGIYLSLGERKVKVAGQILTEVLCVAMIAMTLSLFTGNILSGTLSDQMLRDRIAAGQQITEGDYLLSELGYMGYHDTPSGSDIVDIYAVSLDLTTVLLFYAVGIGTICISTLIPVIYTTRLDPKRIMM
ncbi:MAG: ABC transporter permease [Peptococcaceae bacterium]|nr:ABC transporter permease [Peptococcaceae bacterium]